MVRWVRRHCPPDTGFEIRALAVWGRARYLSVTEAPHSFTSGWGRNIFVSFKPPIPGNEPRTLAWKAAVSTTTLPRLWTHRLRWSPGTLCTFSSDAANVSAPSLCHWEYHYFQWDDFFLVPLDLAPVSWKNEFQNSVLFLAPSSLTICSCQALSLSVLIDSLTSLVRLFVHSHVLGIVTESHS